MVGDGGHDDGEAAEDGERSHAALDNGLEMEVVAWYKHGQKRGL